MGSLIFPKDLPADWFNRYGQETIEQFAKNLRHAWLDEREFDFYKQYVGYGPSMFTLSATSLFPPSNLDGTVRLYDTPAFCYMLDLSLSQQAKRLKPKTLHFEEVNFPVSPFLWLREACYLWTKDMDEIVACDNKPAFGLIRLANDEYSHFEDWLGLGLKSNLDAGESQEAQEKGLRALIQQHISLCDLVHHRAHGPSTPPSDKAERKWNKREWNERKWNANAILSPVCRAVFYIATRNLKDDKRVLLVLTGETAP